MKYATICLIKDFIMMSLVLTTTNILVQIIAMVIFKYNVY